MLVGMGFTEDEVWNMPLNKFYTYSESASRIKVLDREIMIRDTCAAIVGALDKGPGDYVKKLRED